jgi:hypothetical protein
VIEFGVTKVGGETTWFVRDNGAGFAMADAENLFLPFLRLRGAPDLGWHGIGLATVARVVERHGGQIWTEAGSRTGSGGDFLFHLALHQCKGVNRHHFITVSRNGESCIVRVVLELLRGRAEKAYSGLVSYCRLGETGQCRGEVVFFHGYGVSQI